MPRIRINCDDFGMHPSINDAVVELLAKGLVSSASIMPVSPSFEDAVTKLRAAGLNRCGVHLSLEAEFPRLPMRPICGQLAGLTDADGYLLRDIDPSFDRIDPALAAAEMRAQAAKASAAGLEISHIDGHMFFYDREGSPSYLLEIALELGRELGVPVRRKDRDCVMIWDGPQTVEERRAAYRELFAAYRCDMIELIAHPGADLAAMGAFTANAERRWADYLVLKDSVPGWMELYGIDLG